MSFQRAVSFVIHEEGGLSLDPRDPGGATNFGISQRSYPGLKISQLSRDDAVAIYKRDFWDRLPGSLPDPVSFFLLDFAVNAGIGRAVRCLQLAIGVRDDGAFGAASRKALAARAVDEVLTLFAAERARHYALLDELDDVYARGWMRRTMRAFRAALALLDD